MVMNIGCSPIRLTGAKSRGTAIGMLGAAPFIVTNAEETAMNKVWPSGVAPAAARAATEPPAPGWFITTICWSQPCWCQIWPRRSATIRRIASGALPGAESEMSLSGPDG
jgi:hypothetical protein